MTLSSPRSLALLTLLVAWTASAPGQAPTNRVSAVRTLVFPAASFKLPPIGALG